MDALPTLDDISHRLCKFLWQFSQYKTYFTCEKAEQLIEIEHFQTLLWGPLGLRGLCRELDSEARAKILLAACVFEVNQGTGACADFHSGLESLLAYYPAFLEYTQGPGNLQDLYAHYAKYLRKKIEHITVRLNLASDLSLAEQQAYSQTILNTITQKSSQAASA